MNSDAYRLFKTLKEITECCQEREVTQAKINGCTVAEARCLLTIKLDQCRTTSEIAEKMMENGDQWRMISLYAAKMGRNRDLGQERLTELSEMIIKRADMEKSLFTDLMKIVK